jgi:hypothetical protein
MHCYTKRSGLIAGGSKRSSPATSALLVAGLEVVSRVLSRMPVASIGRISAAAFLFMLPPCAQCVEFSAEMAYAGDGQMDWGKAYVAGEKVRLEFQKGWTIRIVDFKKNTEYESINHAPATASQLGRRALELLAGGPLRQPANPCEQIVSWLGVSGRERDHLSCKAGPAVLLNERHTEQWNFTVSKGRNTLAVTAWVDPALEHCIRIQVAADGKIAVIQELRNIEVGRQPTTLFEIPGASRAAP